MAAATKEAFVYVVDLGPSLNECHNGRKESDLEYGLRYVWDKLATAMASNRATCKAGIVAFRTDDTNNDLGDGYENISVLNPIEQITVSQLPELRKLLVPNEAEGGDAISAVVVAIDMIRKETTLKTGKLGKYIRKIILLTDGQGTIDDEGLDSIAAKINEVGIELIVVGIDFDDPDYGFKEEDKAPLKKMNESILRTLTEKCTEGIFATAAEVIDSLTIPHVKSSRPYATYEGRLGLGDFDAYPDTAMFIDVKRFFKTKTAKAVSASSFVSRVPFNGESNAVDTEMADAPADDLSAVRNARTYKVNDASAPGGKRDVDREDLEKGYEYGRTAVHINESDTNVTDFETFKSFTIIGFIPSDKYERYLNMGESCITIAQSVNEKARMALSSLIHALYELESYAVARIVLKDTKPPRIILLAPVIEPDLEALVDVPLPFAEDIRAYKFPPLGKVVTISGASLEKHRNIPTDDLVSAMDDYVDSMDLSTFGKDDDGEPCEYMPITETYSPMVHRVNQAVRQRALYPDQPIDPPADVLMKWSEPPAELVKASKPQLEALISAADVKKVPPKAKGRLGRKEPLKPLSGLDVSSLLNREKRQKISAENAIPEFKQMLQDTEDDNVVADAVHQMSRIIRELISKSFGDSGYAQAKQNMTVMRDEMIDFEMSNLYNDFIRDLKKRLVKQELGGDRRDFWVQVKPAKLGLIDVNVLEHSDVSEEQAREFYSLRSDLPNRAK